jgi:hypothetical protein
VIFLYPTANADFLPRIHPVLHASNAVLPKIKFQIPFPAGNLPSFIKVSFYCCSLNTKLSFYSERFLSAAHSQRFHFSRPIQCCTLYLGNLYKNSSGHSTFTSLNFMFPPVMANTVAPLTAATLIYLLLSFVLNGIRFDPHLDEGEIEKTLILSCRIMFLAMT